MAFNKRTDAYRIKDIDPVHAIFPYIMPKRTEAEVSLNERFDVTSLLKYLNGRNDEQGTKIKFFHAVCYATGRMIYHRPLLNSYVSGRRYWMRNDITLSFIAKQEFADGSAEHLMTLTIKPDMTIDSISKIILGDVTKARNSDSGNDMDHTLSTLAKIPRFLLVPIFAIANRLEYHSLMPASLMANDTNFSTMLLSNLGSIKCGAPYHHLNNYGSNSMVTTIGTIRKELFDDGSVHDIVELQVTVDERIADGFYFAKSLKLVHYLLENPEKLEETIGTEFPEGII